MEEGQQVTVRGPYGNGFPVDADFVGKDLVFVAGGESAMWAALRSFFLNQFDVDLDEGMPAAGNAKQLNLSL